MVDGGRVFARSARQPTFVLLKRCLRSPNAQSGANLVWPTIMKLISTLSFRPAITLHARYCMTKLEVVLWLRGQQVISMVYTYRFLFCPLQLSACSFRTDSPRPWVSRKWWMRLMTQFPPFPMLAASSIK